MHATAAKPSDQDIHDRVLAAILGRRLHPGARLVEDDLARLFGVSRTKVRHALAKLAQEGVVQVRRNFGATVAAPSRTEARHVFEFRRMVEPALAARLAQDRLARDHLAHDRPAADLADLRAHVAAEQEARARNDHAALIRLTGEFHLHLAGLHGNALLVRTLREAEAMTCLCILSYGRPHASACLPDEHARILDAVDAGDAEAAASLMLSHLHHVEAEMDLDEPAAPPGLAQALRPDRAA